MHAARAVNLSQLWHAEASVGTRKLKVIHRDWQRFISTCYIAGIEWSSLLYGKYKVLQRWWASLQNECKYKSFHLQIALSQNLVSVYSSVCFWWERVQVFCWDPLKIKPASISGEVFVNKKKPGRLFSSHFTQFPWNAGHGTRCPSR